LLSFWSDHGLRLHLLAWHGGFLMTESIGIAYRSWVNFDIDRMQRISSYCFS